MVNIKIVVVIRRTVVANSVLGPSRRILRVRSKGGIDRIDQLKKIVSEEDQRESDRRRRITVRIGRKKINMEGLRSIA